MLMRSPPSSQRGASIVAAIFVLVVLSLLAAAMFNLLAGTTDSVAREVISTRALFAAESGAQRRLNEVFVGGGSCNSCASGGSLSSYGAGVDWYDSCAASVSCCTHSPGNGSTYYTITSTGRCGPVGDKASRTVELQARDN